MNLNEISYEWLIGFRESTLKAVVESFGTGLYKRNWYFAWTHFRGEINAPTINRIYMHIGVQAQVMAEYES
jgi:hypothetical protein